MELQKDPHFGATLINFTNHFTVILRYSSNSFSNTTQIYN